MTAGKFYLPMEIDTTFGEWLQFELNKRGWSQSDLAVKSKITPAQIGRLIAGTRNPGKESLNAIAKAFDISPVIVFQIAGFLPQDVDTDEIIENTLSAIKGLSKRDRQDVYEYALFRKQIAEQKSKYST